MPCLIVAFAMPTDWWDFTVKLIAALAVFGGPSLVIFLTRRGNLEDRSTAKRMAVEDLYINGAKDLIRTLQEQLTLRSAEVATANRKITVLKEEVDSANKAFSSYHDQYKRLLDLLQQKGVKIPTDSDTPA